jgi:hypothetical protein
MPVGQVTFLSKTEEKKNLFQKLLGIRHSENIPFSNIFSNMKTSVRDI